MKSKVNSLFSSITYRLGSTVIDPGDEQDWSDVESVLLTHAHFDHIYGLSAIWEHNHNIKIYTNQFGCQALIDPKLNLSKYHGAPFTFNHPENVIVIGDNKTVTIEDTLSAIAHFTPGHNPSCITWVIDDCVFSGDSLIPGVKTVTNLPNGDKTAALASEQLIRQLAINRKLNPGHPSNTDR